MTATATLHARAVPRSATAAGWIDRLSGRLHELGARVPEATLLAS